MVPTPEWIEQARPFASRHVYQFCKQKGDPSAQAAQTAEASVAHAESELYECDFEDFKHYRNTLRKRAQQRAIDLHRPRRREGERFSNDTVIDIVPSVGPTPFDLLVGGELMDHCLTKLKKADAQIFRIVYNLFESLDQYTLVLNHILIQKDRVLQRLFGLQDDQSEKQWYREIRNCLRSIQQHLQRAIGPTRKER